MNRRTFLAKTPVASLSFGEDQPNQETKVVDNPFANKTLPHVARTNSGLEPYAGPWGYDQVAHLLRRTMFGAKKSDVTSLISKSLDEVITILLSDLPTPDPPLNTSSADPDVAVGVTWVNAATNSSNTARNNSLKSWWVGLMVNQPVSLLEKMILFWHNHFVSESVEVKDARLSYKQHMLFRQFAFGNFRELAKQVTIDPAMLRYLNGNTNTATNPNENYARELQELFTIGKGPEIAPGNYTNYTEDDVKAAARVLTGWRDQSSSLSSYFTASRHDSGNKQFSSDYGNALIVGRTGPDGANEIDDLLNIIFAQQETAKFICRKLYRWFVYYLIDPAVETNIIVPLADIFRDNNYEIKPVVQALLKSAHFFDPVNAGCMIKNPVDLTVGTLRQLSVFFPDGSNLTAQYNMWKYARTQAANMQMDIIDPPNVAGWAAYYQIPQYYELWINSDTLPKRNQFTDIIINNGYQQNGFKLIADPISLMNQISNPYDPNTIVAEFSQILFPFAITNNQKAFLKETLIPGLPDYEWTIEWNDYLQDPTNQEKLLAVKSKLQALLSFMMDMAEHQLC